MMVSWISIGNVIALNVGPERVEHTPWFWGLCAELGALPSELDGSRTKDGKGEPDLSDIMEWVARHEEPQR